MQSAISRKIKIPRRGKLAPGAPNYRKFADDRAARPKSKPFRMS